jgi:hypothetical protein
VVAVKDRPGQAAAGQVGGGECLLDELGAHVLRDRPTGQAPAGAVDDGGQVKVRPVGQRQVGDVPDVALIRRLGGEVPLEQVGHRLIRGLGHGGADLALLDVAADTGHAHHPRDPLVVDPLTRWDTVVAARQ